MSCQINFKTCVGFDRNIKRLIMYYAKAQKLNSEKEMGGVIIDTADMVSYGSFKIYKEETQSNKNLKEAC